MLFWRPAPARPGAWGVDAVPGDPPLTLAMSCEEEDYYSEEFQPARPSDGEVLPLWVLVGDSRTGLGRV